MEKFKKEDFNRIELKTPDTKAIYHSVTRTVTMCTKNGVMVESEMPKDWDLTRIFQFMDSLVKAEKDLI